MKKYFNNSGSTMVLLVMSIGIISILGISILGVTMMNLKIKKTNTDIKQSFYLSESGLDIAYSETYSLIMEAVAESNKNAKEFIQQFTPEKLEELVELLITDPSSEELDYIHDSDGNGSYEFNETAIQNKAKNIFANYFYNYLTVANYDGIEHKNIIKRLKDINSNPVVKLGNIYFDGKKLTIEDDDNLSSEDSIDVSEDKELRISIDSLYDKEGIKKSTSVDLDIVIPRFNEPYKVSIEVIPINPFWTKILTAKNINLNGDSVITGDSYISNNLNVGNDNILATFKGNLAVKGNVNINGENAITQVKDVYATNILLNGKGVKLKTIDGLSGSLYIKDDLEINDSNQEVNINGSYYGFSDGTLNPTPDMSSGININNTENLKLTVSDNVYLYGTSYININDEIKYQTGESVSVKGNYKAYMEPLTDSSIPESFRNIIFSDYDYLRLAHSFSDGTPLYYMDKSDYLGYYSYEYGGLNIPTGINLATEAGKKIVSIGSIINNGELFESNFYLDDTINTVFSGSASAYYLETDRLGDNTVVTGSNLEFDTEVKLNLIENNIEDKETNNGITELVYINKDNTFTYELEGGTYEGLIVTNGNIIISGNVDFTGAIICGGNITIEGTDNSFTYSRSIVERIIAERDLHNKLFKSDTSNLEPFVITTYQDEDEDGDGDTMNVDFSKLIKFSNWDIK